jgi:hypothetical protein
MCPRKDIGLPVDPHVFKPAASCTDRSTRACRGKRLGVPWWGTDREAPGAHASAHMLDGRLDGMR